MDLATILGMVVSFGLIMTALFLGGAPTSFIDVPAMLIVFGGTFGATLTHYPLGTFLRIGTIIRKTLVAKTPSSHMYWLMSNGTACEETRSGLNPLFASSSVF